MSVIDELRGLYVKSPYWLRAIASPILSLAPVRFKYGPTYRQLTKMILRSENDEEFVEKYRLQKLQMIVTSCWQRNAYYKRLFRATYGSDFEPTSFGFDDYKSLPILKKEDFRSNPEQLMVKSLSELDLATTSGTSGIPLTFYLDKNRSVKEWAFVHCLWARNGYRPGMPIAVLRGIHIRHADRQPWEYDKALAELRLSAFHLVPEVIEQYLELLKRYKIRYIWGYPSAIVQIANFALANSWKPPASLKGVIPISETLYSHQRSAIAKAFQSDNILSSYGLSEKVAIAGELPGQPDVYEFEPLYGITELVDDEGASIDEIGRVGRIVGTGFISTGMPLLRYDTGDVGELVRKATRANKHRLRLKGIRSRWGQEFIVADNGALISIAAINIHSPAYSKIQQFQFYQDTPGEAKVLVVPVSGSGREDLVPFVSEIQRKVGSHVEFSLEITKTIPRSERGKQRFIDQKLDLSAFS